MGSIREISDKLFTGELPIAEHHPLGFTGDSEEVAAGVMFYRWFANVTAIKTAEGLTLIDTGAYFNQQNTLEMIRRFSRDRINTVIYTHGHVDHACGTPAILTEAAHNRTARPRVVGHRAVGPRFDRYKRTAGYNSVVNTRQFSRPSRWPTEYVYPDTYFDHQLSVVVANHKFDCHHARGETDDHCWVFMPEPKVLFTGDLIIWAVPNAGNPQKAQRYAREWAEALRAMAKVSASVLVPGHGYPVFGAARVRQILNDTAEYLESVYQQTLAMMNQGASLDEVLHSVRPPEKFRDRPYLQPVYDESEFIVRNVWRHEGGWYDGAPSHLSPASEAEQAREIAEIAGGAARLVARALENFAAGNLALACHLADWAVAAAPDDKAAHEARVRIYQARADQSKSTMSHGIYRSAALESAAKAGVAPPDDKRSM